MLEFRVQIINERHGSFEWWAWMDDVEYASATRQRKRSIHLGKLTPSRRYHSVKGALKAAQRVAKTMGGKIRLAGFDEVKYLENGGRQYVGQTKYLVDET